MSREGGPGPAEIVPDPLVVEAELERRAGPPREQRHTWAIVLAGGDGVRLRPFVQEVLGADRPKQYVPLIGKQSLLRQTLDRVGLLVPPERTVVVSKESHAAWVAAEIEGQPTPTVLLQPEDRDTAAGIFLPVHWIWANDPEAVVAILPSDHFVLEEGAFAAHVAATMGFATQHPGWLVLTGARALAPEQEYGWIEPGERLARLLDGDVYRALRFVEKPSAQVAAACLARGWLWNTFVMAADIDTLLDLEQQHLPQLRERLGVVGVFAGTRREQWAIREAYRGLPSRNFSRAILQARLDQAAVATLPAITWSDVGSPRRLLALLQTLGISPPWMAKPPARIGRSRPSRHKEVRS